MSKVTSCKTFYKCNYGLSNGASRSHGACISQLTVFSLSLFLIIGTFAGVVRHHLRMREREREKEKE